MIDANNAITADKKLSGRVIASAQTMDHNYGGYTGDQDYVFAPSLRYKDRLTDIVIGANLSQGLTGLGANTIFNTNSRRIIDRDSAIPIYSPNQYLRTATTRYSFDATRQVTSGIELVARGLHDDSTLLAQAGALDYRPNNTLFYTFSGSRQEGRSDGLDSFLRIKTHLGDVLKARFNIGYSYSAGRTLRSTGNGYVSVPNVPLGANTTIPVKPFPPMGRPYSNTSGKQEGIYGRH